MFKLILAFFFVSQSIFCFSQNKKAQIEILNSRVDSLFQEVKSKDSVILVNEFALKRNKISIDSLNAEFSIYEKLYKDLVVEKNQIQKHLKQLQTDSVQKHSQINAQEKQSLDLKNKVLEQEKIIKKYEKDLDIIKIWNGNYSYWYLENDVKIPKLAITNQSEFGFEFNIIFMREYHAPYEVAYFHYSGKAIFTEDLSIAKCDKIFQKGEKNSRYVVLYSEEDLKNQKISLTFTLVKNQIFIEIKDPLYYDDDHIYDNMYSVKR